MSITGFQAFTGAGGSTSSTTTSITRSGASTKITLENPILNKPYSAGAYKAEWALIPGAGKTAIAARGVGNYWKASFKGGPAMIESVRIRNRHDCCGNRIAGTKVTISGQLCGTISGGSNGQWITVKCSKPLVGTEI